MKILLTILVFCMIILFPACSQKNNAANDNNVEAATESVLTESTNITNSEAKAVNTETKSDFPQKVINLLQYTDSEQKDYVTRYLRIWGWSGNGKLAYSFEGYINSESSYQIDFIIFDFNINEVIFSLSGEPTYDNDYLEGEELFNLLEDQIIDAFRTHEIIRQETEFLAFPITRNNIVYDVQIIDIEYGEDEHWMLGETMLKYTVLATVNNERKVIGNFTPYRWLFDVHVCGYFLSPFENRALLIIAEDLGQYQHGGMIYRFISFDL